MEGGSLNRTPAKQQEALIKTELMKGIVRSDQAKSLTFKEWGEAYLELEDVKRLRSRKDRVNVVRLQLIPFILKHCLNVARRKRLLTVNPASLVPIPCANNERDRVLTVEEWQRLYETASSHPKPILQTGDPPLIS